MITSGRKDLQDEFADVIYSKKIDHERQTLINYPGSEGFEAESESFRTVAVPHLVATLQALRKRLGAPLNKLENATASIEQDIQKKVDNWFSQHQAADTAEATEGDKG